MGKPKKQRRKNFNYDKNRKKTWKKSKKMPSINCEAIQSAWDKRKSLKKNMEEMGLMADPNKVVKHVQPQVNSLDGDQETTTTTAAKDYVMKAIEAEANIPAAKTNKLSELDVIFCTYLMDKHGEDYKAMARDRKNHYQETPKQIKKKINMFKNTPSQYEAYLKSKGEVR